jgi:hypothetical protein
VKLGRVLDRVTSRVGRLSSNVQVGSGWVSRALAALAAIFEASSVWHEQMVIED